MVNSAYGLCVLHIINTVDEQVLKADLIAQCDDLRSQLAKERESSNSLNKDLSVAAERQNELLRCVKTLENKVQQQRKVCIGLTCT